MYSDDLFPLGEDTGHGSWGGAVPSIREALLPYRDHVIS